MNPGMLSLYLHRQFVERLNQEHDLKVKELSAAHEKKLEAALAEQETAWLEKLETSESALAASKKEVEQLTDRLETVLKEPNVRSKTTSRSK